MKAMTEYNIALVHDWLNGMRGGEKVLEYLCEMFPQATIFTLHSELQAVSKTIQQHRIKHSFIQHLPLKKKYYRCYLPFFPLAVKQFDFSNFDLIISTSHCAAKNIVPPPHIPHLCYCFSPMRYIWGLQEDYLGKSKIKQLLSQLPMTVLRRWDKKGSERVTQFIAISKTIQERIQTSYGRSSDIIYPPTELAFQPYHPKEDYFLVLSALVPYKRVDLAIEACKRLDLPLKIAGTGPCLEKLKSIAGSQTEFLGWVSDDEKQRLLKSARALLFPGFEDFGIVPLEAMAFATPVIGYGKGGLTETVADGQTGIFFSDQTTESVIKALQRFEKTSFNVEDFQKQLEPFSVENFKTQFLNTIRSRIL